MQWESLFWSSFQYPDNVIIFRCRGKKRGWGGVLVIIGVIVLEMREFCLLGDCARIVNILVK